MLQKLNERIKGVIAWVVIVMIAITFALFGIDYYMQTHHSSEVNVEVNGQPISAQLVERSFRQARQFGSQHKSGENEQVLRKRVLEDLILTQVSLQAAHKNGFQVTEAQADTTILNIPQFQEDGRFSSQRYEQLLNNYLYTPGAFREEVKQGMLLSQQRFALIGSSFVLPNEIEQFVNLFLQTRDYNYLKIPFNVFLDKNQVAEESAKKYYEQYNEEFFTPEQISLQYVHLDMHDIKRKLKISEEKIKQYYEENKNSFLSPAQWQVDSILFEVPNNATPEEEDKIKQTAEDASYKLKEGPQLFHEFSQTKAGGKNTPQEKKFSWVASGQAGFDEIFTTLTVPGQISSPVKSPKGYKIYKLINYKPSQIQPFAEVKSQITSQLINELSQSAYAQAVDELNDLSYQTPDSLKPVSEALKLPLLETKAFNRKDIDIHSLVLKNEQVISTAFSHDVLTLGNNSEPIQLEDNSVIVLRVKDHIPARKQSFSEIKPVIVDKLAKKAAIEEAKTFVTKLLNEKDTQEQNKLMNQYQLNWKDVKEISRTSKKVESKVNDFAFSLPTSVQCDSRLDEAEYLIVCLKKVNKGQLNQLDKERQASLTQQLESSYGTMDYDLYIKQLLSAAKIKRH